jgi:hypothetical protein
MKVLLGIMSLVALSFMFNSCEENVSLIGDFEETVVVYGILDQADSVHYIKINRAFIGPGNSYDLAQIPDSSYFTDVVATVTEVGGAGRVWTLVDTLVDNKDPNGVFFSPTQKLYYFHTINQAGLNPSAKYRLDISVKGGALKVQAETEIVTGITSTASSQNFSFKFADDPGSYVTSAVNVSNVGNSYVVNTALDINFYEYEGTAYNLKTAKWSLGEADVVPQSSKAFSASGNSFYTLIKSNITQNSAITKRTLKSLTVRITGGAEELYNYMTVNKPSSTLAQSKPTYTNLSIIGEGRVLGIFSSRQTVTFEKPFYVSAQQAYIRAIDKKSTRELCTGPITGTYLFCSPHPGDLTEPWACQ